MPYKFIWTSEALRTQKNDYLIDGRASTAWCYFGNYVIIFLDRTRLKNIKGA